MVAAAFHPALVPTSYSPRPDAQRAPRVPLPFRAGPLAAASRAPPVHSSGVLAVSARASFSAIQREFPERRVGDVHAMQKQQKR